MTATASNGPKPDAARSRHSPSLPEGATFPPRPPFKFCHSQGMLDRSEPSFNKNNTSIATSQKPGKASRRSELFRMNWQTGRRTTGLPISYRPDHQLILASRAAMTYAERVGGRQ
ncbi:hypothetical protein BO82DRAFT_131464 [Aspergillus uvarum CBS 121591]|uniref:Uncharacterized protein n=1 Tax=Aspergillus uvarum CBS 121591 TaxID=1448315 RepID=A0A319C625_9EURO|nr:hypothetical protein BO82DRAFT_131464 [Aspergillus uvarum CBS 121591]PYH79551.1 hypothetical protein BO82DRAFT_131464 [Aspergillus uvarum CBS 121591]